MEIETSQITAPAAPSDLGRRLDSSLLDKSLDELIKANRSERKSTKKKNGKAAQKGQPKNGGVKKISLQDGGVTKISLQDGGVKKISLQELRSGRKLSEVATSKRNQKGNEKQRNNKPANHQKPLKQTPKNLPRNTPGIRQPWEKPVSLPAAPLPAQPLKISIRNELADRQHHDSMDWSSTSASSSRNYSSRDRVEGRKEYRIGSRDSTQPMNIDYDYHHRRY